MNSEDLELAHELASVATATALSYFAAGVRHDLKADGSPVSEADLAVEKKLIELLRARRPDDGIVSEEAGEVETGRRRWLLDPIDGTDAFVAGHDWWGTHISLQADDEITFAIITRPVLRSRYWAAAGEGAYRDSDGTPTARERRLQVSTVDRLDGASIGVFAAPDSRVPDLLAAAGARAHLPGSLIPDLLERRLDAVVSHHCGFVWDHAPAVLLVSEAGGRYTDPAGGRRPDRRGALATNGRLDDALRAALAPVWP